MTLNRRQFLQVAAAGALQSPSRPLATAVPMTIDFSPRHDAVRVLRNPGKGWYHHLFDNGIGQYAVRQDSDLLDFPGMNHIYLRLAWSFLEPRKGHFNWQLIDEPIEKWTKLGLGVAFRITCKETSNDQFGRFATPEWVKDDGAAGKWVEAWGVRSWSPDYGDAIFLRHLSDFHRAFAARYADKKWLRYIDIGSYGQWGEAHNYMAGGGDASIEALQKHVEIHRQHYPHNLLVVSDDIAAREDNRGDELARWLEEKGVSYRDDSILVKYYADTYPHDSVRAPAQFERVWKRRPTVLELQHFGMMKNAAQDNTWRGANGQQYGADLFRHAIETMHASYIGYHGFADEWRRDNPQLSDELANRCGYWLFPHRVQISRLRSGVGELRLTMENRGVAPPYRRFGAQLKWSGAQTSKLPPLKLSLDGLDSRRWLPGQIEQSARFQWPANLRGKFQMSLQFLDDQTPIRFALRDENTTLDIGTVEVV